MQSRSFVRATFALSLLLGAIRIVSADGVARQTVHFELSYQTAFGDSIFLLGDISELGNNDLTRSIKLIPVSQPGGGLLWQADVAIPLGTDFSYQYYVRDDSLSQWSNPSNGTPIGAPASASTADPSPLTRTLRLYIIGAASISQVTFNTELGPVIVPLVPVAGQTNMRLGELANQPNGDGIDAQVNNGHVDIDLHTIVRYSGPLYNYVPDVAVTPDSKETFVLPTTTVPETRTINGVAGRGIQVWLPRGYAVHPWRHYPVLYMHDGQNIFNPGGPFGCWCIDDVGDQLMRQGQIREMIVVGIDNSSQRSAEYVPELGNSTVTNDDYNSFIINELKPVIDANYRTLPDRENTGIMGSSFGGIASLVLGMEYPSVFGKVGAMSSSFWVGQTANRMASGEMPMSVRLYLDAGDTSDGGDDTVAVRDELLADGRVLNQNLFFQIGYGHSHNEAYWNLRLPEALGALFPLRDEPNGAEDLIVCPGDVNRDLVVGPQDLASLLSAWGSEPGDPAWNAAADLDANELIDAQDLALLLANWNASCL